MHRLRKTTPKLTDEQKQGYALLETSEASSRGLEAPMRTYGLMQIATAYPTTGETKKTRELLRDASHRLWKYRMIMRPGRNCRRKFSAHCCRYRRMTWKSCYPRRIQSRKETSEQMIRTYTSKKQFEKAIDLVNQVTSWDEFPYASASGLMMPCRLT